MVRSEEKEVMKEAIQEWLDSKFALLGKWSAGAITAAALVSIVYFILAWNGWKITP